MTKYIRHGIGAVRPYLYGNPALPAFLAAVFGATELECAESSTGAHVELRIADSVLVVEAADWPASDQTPRGSVFVYVSDVDAIYARALAQGATSITAPEDKPYGERGAGFKDGFGNTWWIGTFTGGKAGSP